MKNATHIAIILDRSGSMQCIADDIIGGFNRFLKDQQAVKGEATITLVQFDSTSIDTIYDAKSITVVSTLSRLDYVPRDSTPLYDAVGQTIVRTGDYLKGLPEAQRPDKVIVVIVTDGLENSSRKFTHPQVSDMIKHQREVYKWEFVFLGATIDSYAVGGQLCIAPANTMNFAPNSQSVHAAFCSTSDNATLYRCSAKSSMDYEEEHRDAQIAAGADQTGAPKKKK